MKVSKAASFADILRNSRYFKLSEMDSLKGPNVFIRGKIYQDGEFLDNNVLYMYDGKILPYDRFEKSVGKSEAIRLIDLDKNYITPSLLDQHIHGGYGIDFNNANESEIRDLLLNLKKHGHSGILATFVPDKIEKLNRQMDIVRKIMKKPDKDATRIIGINLEGPFLNPKKAGIHPPEILLKPTVKNLEKLNLDDVKMITIAPELDKDFAATEYLNKRGIITSAGHSSATAEQVRNSGVKQVTHLFNAMSPFHHRIPSIANEGLLNDRIYAEVNTAPELLSPETVNLIMKVKPKDRIILISDALRGANIDGDSFVMGGKKIYIDENGIAKDKDGILAGSIKFMGQIAKQLVESTRMTFADFIRFASTNPSVNLDVEKGYKLEMNSYPNVTIWDKDTLKPINTFISNA